MDVYEAIKTRRSVRKYKSTPISEEILNKILEAVRLAPSSHNSQNYKLVIVRDQKKKDKLASSGAWSKFINQAPIVIVGVSLDQETDESSNVPFYAVNLAIAFDHLSLAAAAEGLGTCWIGAFDRKEVKKILDIPEKYGVIALMPLGYSDDKAGKKIRKELGKLVCQDKWIDS